MNKLTDREIEVINAVKKYKYRKIAAEKMDLSLRTIDTHLQNSYRKFKVRSFYELLVKIGMVK